MHPLVSSDWLFSRLHEPTIRILDASWYLPNEPREPVREFEFNHIPGAQFFDLDAVINHRSSLPHMLPDPKVFAATVGRLGIGNAHQVIVYDTVGLFSAARVWWMFKVMGHQNVAILNGGLPKWLHDGHQLEHHTNTPLIAAFTPNFTPVSVCDANDVNAAVIRGSDQILDARPESRFVGEAAEPRVGLRAGHIPTSRNLFYKKLLKANGEMKDVAELRIIFEDAGIDLSRPVITTCGSGVTAAILSLALTILNHRGNRLYDGSWAEWGANPDLDIELGAPS